MQDWMDEFRKDRMRDYAASNPCINDINSTVPLASAKTGLIDFLAKLAKILGGNR